MKLTIDDVAKTIEVSEDVLLSDLFSRLDSLFPGKEWHQYTLKTTVVRFETQPYIPQPFPYIPQYPTYPIITYGNGTGDLPCCEIINTTSN